MNNENIEDENINEDGVSMDELKRFRLEKIEQAQREAKAQKLELRLQARRERITRLRNSRKKLLKRVQKLGTGIKQGTSYTVKGFSNSVFRRSTILYLSWLYSYHTLSKQLADIQNQLQRQQMEIVRLQADIRNGQENELTWGTTLMRQWPSILIWGTTIFQQVWAYWEQKSIKTQILKTETNIKASVKEADESIDESIQDMGDKMGEKIEKVDDSIQAIARDTKDSFQSLDEKLEYRDEISFQREKRAQEKLIKMNEETIQVTEKNVKTLENLIEEAKLRCQAENKIKEYRLQLAESKQKLEKLNQEKDQLQKEYQQTSKKLEQSIKENVKLTQKAQKDAVVTAELRQEISNRKSDANRLQRQLKREKQERIEREKKIDKLYSDIVQKEKNTAKLQAQNLQAQENLNSKQQQLEDQQQQRLKEYDQYQKTLQEIEKLKQKQANQAEKFGTWQKLKKTRQRRELNRKINKLENQENQLQQEISQSEKKCQKLEKEKLKADNKAKRARMKQNQADERLNSLQNDYEILQAESDGKDQANAFLQAKLQQNNDNLQTKKRELIRLEETTSAYQNKLKQDKQKYDLYVEQKELAEKNLQDIISAQEQLLVEKTAKISQKEAELQKVRWRKIIPKFEFQLKAEKKVKKPKIRTFMYLPNPFAPTITASEGDEKKGWQEINSKSTNEFIKDSSRKNRK